MSNAHRIRPGVIFQLTQDLASLPESTRLRNIEWGILLAITGRHSVAQIGEHFELTTEDRDRAFNRLLALGLIVEREVSFTEYLLAASTVDDNEPKSLARFLRSGAAFGPDPARPLIPPAIQGKGSPTDMAIAKSARPQRAGAQPLTSIPPVPKKLLPGSSPPSAVLGRVRPEETPGRTVPATSPPLPKSSAGSPVSLGTSRSLMPTPEMMSRTALLDPLETLDQPADEATTRAIPTASLAAMNFEPLPPAEDVQAVRTTKVSSDAQVPGASSHTPSSDPQRRRRLSVKAVMRFILDRATDINSGQLDVYRVFIRVNTKLLKRNGIHTLRFQEDQLITDPELQEAIVTSVKKTLNLQCPQTVFV